MPPAKPRLQPVALGLCNTRLHIPLGFLILKLLDGVFLRLGLCPAPQAFDRLKIAHFLTEALCSPLSPTKHA